MFIGSDNSLQHAIESVLRYLPWSLEVKLCGGVGQLRFSSIFKGYFFWIPSYKYLTEGKVMILGRQVPVLKGDIIMF